MKTFILFGFVLGALSAAGKVYFAEVGQKVTLQCGDNRFSSRLDWIHGGRTIFKVMGKNSPTSKGNSPFASRAQRRRDTDLEISNVKESDFGEFTCKVDGKPYKHTLVVVSVSVFPSGVLQSGTDVTLDCKVSSLGDSIKGWWRSPDGSEQQSQKVELKPVDPSHQGTWQCRASHEGEEFSKDVAIVVKSPDPKPTTPAVKRNPGLSWWIWVAIGAAGLVFIILMVVVVVVYKRTKRRKKTFMRMKRAPPPLMTPDVEVNGILGSHGNEVDDSLYFPLLSPVLDDSTVSQLCEMGFPVEACRKAVYYTGNTGIDAAMNWIMSHMDDPDFSAPLVLPGSSSGPGTTPTESLSEEHLATIVSMGFSRDQATKALRATYELFAFISHMGTSTMCGHYVCHIKKDQQWVIFNDQKVCASEKPPKDLGYLYFYRRVAD